MNEATTPMRSRRQWAAAARSRVAKGEAGSEIEAEFLREGLDPEQAKTIVDDAIGSVRSRATGLLVGSIAFAGLGLIVTVASYSAATSNPYGGTYFIWFGPVVVGGITALVALGRLLNIRR